MNSENKLTETIKNKKQIGLDSFIHKYQDKIAQALPKHIDIGQLVRISMFVIKNNPELAKCTQFSLLGAIMQSAQLGLFPNIMGHAWFIPYYNSKTKDNEVQFQIGYKGLMELVRRSGNAVILSAEVVYENDRFEHSAGTETKLLHEPTSAERGNIKGFYAVAKILSANEKVFKYMSKSDVDKIKILSKGGNSEFSPWNKFYEEMGKKTVIKQLCKLLPLSTEIQSFISSDETTKKDFNKDMTNGVNDETDWENGSYEAEIETVNDSKLEKKVSDNN